MEYGKIFERTEEKYILTAAQYERLMPLLSEHIEKDTFSDYNIFSLYFDTPEHRLVRESIEKPEYKEKFRMRSYTQPQNGTDVFLEIKKKYNGIVYKRRIKMPYREAMAYLLYNVYLGEDSQIKKEIDWFKSFYTPLLPSMLISYSRHSFFDKEDKNVRITFDYDVFAQKFEKNEPCGERVRITDKNTVLMEIKIPSSMPLWLCKVLSDEKIYPSSFSKYGTAYKMMRSGIFENKKIEGGAECA